LVPDQTLRRQLDADDGRGLRHIHERAGMRQTAQEARKAACMIACLIILGGCRGCAAVADFRERQRIRRGNEGSTARSDRRQNVHRPCDQKDR
jgi:hypothetical protein